MKPKHNLLAQNSLLHLSKADSCSPCLRSGDRGKQERGKGKQWRAPLVAPPSKPRLLEIRKTALRSGIYIHIKAESPEFSNSKLHLLKLCIQ